MTGNPDNSLTIDTHHHILPDFFWRETNDSHDPVGGLAPLQWSKEAMISFMDDAAIDMAVTSVSTPGVHLGDSEKSRSLARRCNEFAAKLVHTRPDRFASFACIPLPDIDASLEELSYEELERRKSVVFVHPNPSPDAAAHSLGLPDNLIDFPTDTNRAVAQMHYTNRFARTPNVKYIFSHAGGSIPFLAARFAIVDEMGFIPGAEQRGTAADIFRRIYWDTALSASDPVLRMLRDVAGIAQVLFGTARDEDQCERYIDGQENAQRPDEVKPDRNEPGAETRDDVQN